MTTTIATATTTEDTSMSADWVEKEERKMGHQVIVQLILVANMIIEGFPVPYFPPRGSKGGVMRIAPRLYMTRFLPR